MFTVGYIQAWHMQKRDKIFIYTYIYADSKKIPIKIRVCRKLNASITPEYLGII